MTNIWRELVHPPHLGPATPGDSSACSSSTYLPHVDHPPRCSACGVFIVTARLVALFASSIASQACSSRWRHLPVARVVNNHGDKPVARADIDTLGVTRCRAGHSWPTGTRLNGIETCGTMTAVCNTPGTTPRRYSMRFRIPDADLSAWSTPPDPWCVVDPRRRRGRPVVHAEASAFPFTATG